MADDEQVENGDNQAVDVAANYYARLQMPPFVESDVDNWFYLLNFYFRASGIAHDGRRFDTVCSQLPLARLTELRSIIDAAPDTEKYKYIRTELTNYFADSQQKRLRRILHDMPLGDKKPSQLYYEMVQTAKDSLSEAVLLDLWASRLPQSVHAVVVLVKGGVDEKTRIADTVMENVELRQLNAIVPCSSPPKLSEHQAHTSADAPSTSSEAAYLVQEFSKLLTKHQRPSRQRTLTSPRSGQPRISSQRRRDHSIEQFDDCWFHRQFGKRATNCRQPCRIGKNLPSGSRQQL
ncbi:uncharacterized protein LOC129915099 [Episyrphus balteatus]|uniref:uncharacterized protein LOC129909587 n=1 Tax=Episyrphus balteatus TaxID=286459 RepID=UPI002485B4BF|nr:uncharacterized protein LOC129909587 [Episyrphus balteatus]XP_055845176.1 uncharacterized protein LOC129911394 [Episyrphus balteatus]XP_055850536.1 uncharacterized protein LOC129915099 [Episyrphus balteatus]